MRNSGCFFFLLLFCSTPVTAELYRCTGEHGEPSYRQRPCGASGIATVQEPARPGPAQGLRASERAWLKQRQRDGRRAKRSTKPSPASSEKAARLQTHRCRAKRRSLDEVRARLRRGYKPASGEKLRRRRKDYEDYLATFCS